MVTKFKDMIHTDPQGLYSMLFSPEALKQMPEAFANSIVPILKNSLVDSLHTVFLTGLVFIVVGAIFTIFLQKIKLSDRKKMLKSHLQRKKNKLYPIRNEKHRLMAVLFEYNLKSFFVRMIDVFLEIRYIIFCKRLHEMERKENEYD